MGKDGERWGEMGEGKWGSSGEMGKYGGGMGKVGGGKIVLDIDLGLLCYFLFAIVLCFAPKHHPSWLRMGMHTVPSSPGRYGTPCCSQGG